MGHSQISFSLLVFNLTRINTDPLLSLGLFFLFCFISFPCDSSWLFTMQSFSLSCQYLDYSFCRIKFRKHSLLDQSKHQIPMKSSLFVDFGWQQSHLVRMNGNLFFVFISAISRAHSRDGGMAKFHHKSQLKLERRTYNINIHSGWQSLTTESLSLCVLCKICTSKRMF